MINGYVEEAGLVAKKWADTRRSYRASKSTVSSLAFVGGSVEGR